MAITQFVGNFIIAIERVNQRTPLLYIYQVKYKLE